MEITRVQRWVASTLTLTVAYVLASGMVLGALITVDQSRVGAQHGIFVMAGIIAIAAVIGVRLINELSWITAWLLVAFVPSAVGLWVLSRR